MLLPVTQGTAASPCSSLPPPLWLPTSPSYGCCCCYTSCCFIISLISFSGFCWFSLRPLWTLLLALLSLASSYKYLVIKYANTETGIQRERGRWREGVREREEGSSCLPSFWISLVFFFLFDYFKPSLTAFFCASPATPTPTLCVFN